MVVNASFDGQVKFTFEPRFGLRQWTILRDMVDAGPQFTPALHSISWAYEWTPGENVSTCLAAPRIQCREVHHRAMDCPRAEPCLKPRIGCGCGFWAYSTRESWGVGAMGAHTPHISGVIEGWDRVIVGPKGMRASRARVVALALTLTNFDEGLWAGRGVTLQDVEPQVHQGLLRYEVPIFESVDAMLAAFPLTPPPTARLEAS